MQTQLICKNENFSETPIEKVHSLTREEDSLVTALLHDRLNRGGILKVERQTHDENTSLESHWIAVTFEPRWMNIADVTLRAKLAGWFLKYVEVDNGNLILTFGEI